MLQTIHVFIACLLSLSVVGQDLKNANEQDFGMANLREGINKDLEEEKVFVNSRMSFSMYILGVGNIKVNYVVPGLRSCTRFNQAKNITVYIESQSDSITFLKGVTVFKIQKDGKRLYRFTEYKTWSSFSGNRYADIHLIPFQIIRRTNDGYLIEFQNPLESGEYAIKLLEKSNSLKLFGVD